MHRIEQITPVFTSLISNNNNHTNMSENKTSSSSSIRMALNSIPMAPPDPILGTKVAYLNDKSPLKINLGIGAYRTNEGKPYVLPSVRKAEQLIAADNTLNHEYLPQRGYDDFIVAARAMLFGKDTRAVVEGRIASVQSLSGTGSLRLAGEFIRTFMPNSTIYLPNPTWGNHLKVFDKAGLNTDKYSYWDPSTRGLAFDNMLSDLKRIPRGSIVLLHGCAHNPTGVDPTREQWESIAKVMHECDHMAFFDIAYQGFATGDLIADSWSLRHFTNLNIPLICCQSFAKNFGLYNERVGTFNVLCESSDVANNIVSQIQGIIRPMYSNPPAYGARIVHRILTTPALYQQWEQEMIMMSKRIRTCRQLLYDELQKLQTPGDWTHILNQIGMFSFTGLSKAQCETLRTKHHVYLLLNGRVSMCGVNTNNVQHLAQSIDDVVRNIR